jgi:DUF1680 family protein
MKNTVYQAFKPVPFSQVSIDDTFWAPRLQVNIEKTIPHIYRMCMETGRIDAYKLNWKPGQDKAPHQFWDSDVAKWIEASSCSLAKHPDPALDALLDEVIALITSAQQPDGYLNPHYTIVEPDKRWTNLRHGHELYCAGHMIEAGVAHFQATGKSTFRLRIPGWCSEATLMVNDKHIDVHAISQNGYAKIERVWNHSDQVSLQFPMPLVRVYAYPEIAADVGRVALQRGPIVFCLEGADNEVPPHRLALPRISDIQAQYEEKAFGGAVIGVADALAFDISDWNDLLYRTQPPVAHSTTLKAIPYFLWCNRGASTMCVWIHEQTIR